MSQASKYLQEIHDSKYDVLSEEDQIKTIKEAQNGSDEAFEKVFNANIRLVPFFIKGIVDINSSAYMDVINECNIALMNCIKLFNIESDNTFASYVKTAVKRKALRIIQTHTDKGIVRIPEGARKKFREFEEECFKEEDGLKEEQPDFYIPSNPFVSLDIKTDEDEYHKELAITESFEEDVVKQDSRRVLIDVINESLNDREKIIIKSYFGFDGKIKNYEELAEDFGVSGSRIGQIKEVALKKIEEAYQIKNSQKNSFGNSTVTIKAKKQKKSKKKRYTTDPSRVKPLVVNGMTFEQCNELRNQDGSLQFNTGQVDENGELVWWDCTYTDNAGYESWRLGRYRKKQ
jgi:RNA polymerase sigma factor (sigma-70 family)